MEKFDTFFTNLEAKDKVKQNIINRLLIHLKCRMYMVGSELVEQGTMIDKVIFVYKGSAIITKSFHSPVYGRTQLEVVTLPEGSFFGELAAKLSAYTQFGLRAGSQLSKRVDKLYIDGIEHG